ncbi:MAG: ATP-dependent DNA helicase RecG [Demequinaceae bacterium]|nr:ATP-dependent DNA helicase RecG [Demequinaceae bacterium]
MTGEEPRPRLAEPLARVLGTRTAGALAKLGLTTVGELLRHYPRRYGRPGESTDLDTLRTGEYVAVLAEVRSVTMRPMRARGGAILEAVVTDGRGSLGLTFFAKRPGILRIHEDRLRPGRTGIFTGTVREYRGRRQLTHPDYLVVGLDTESEEEALTEASRLIPLYPATAGVPTWRIGRSVRTVLDPITEVDVPDPVPAPLLAKRGHVGLLEALRGVHVPADGEAWARGRARLRYEEALILQVALARRRATARSMRSVARPRIAGGLVEALDACLPFTLTVGQRKVGIDLASDLAGDVPMRRLLQGDVGSGKTVVALRAMLQVIDAGGQAALLAPTEVLAWQHFKTLRGLLGPLADAGTLGAPEIATRVALLTGSLGAEERRSALADAESGGAGIVIGTHALLGEGVRFADLGLVVVDEQHRFGVEQRDVLRTRTEHEPHMLVMTATPIPRTVAMTVFGDLDTSTLTEKPTGRAPVVTHIVPADNRAWLDRTWARVGEEVAAGRRAFVVCARITGDEAEEGDIGEGVIQEQIEGVDLTADGELPLEEVRPHPRTPLHAVGDVAEELRARPELDGVPIGVLHGRLRPEDKDLAMAHFASGEAPVLVSTTVIEVGVDVPEASVMVVLDADHFGISQLHQLRGRIGRADTPGVCLLVSAAGEGTLARDRLEALVETTDGFALAEKDVELRREGDVLGSAQSGGRNSLRLLRVIRDKDIIEEARMDARDIVEADPTLESFPALAAAIEEWLEPEREEFLERS